MKARIKNWSDFQHYKDRKPTWIKLHLALLDDYEWWALPEASRALAPMLWLMAAEDGADGIFDADTAKIAFRLRMSTAKVESAVKPLIAGGWVIPYQSVSNDTDVSDVASLETERETERETEETSSSAEPEASDSTPVVVLSIPLIDGSEYGVTQEHFDELADAFPAVDTLATLKAVRQWNRDNPKRRKTARGIRQHISTWFAKQQDRGRPRSDVATVPSAADSEWNRAYRAIAEDVWNLREMKGVTGGDFSDLKAKHHDCYRDMPQREGKNVVTAAWDMAMNNKRKNWKAASAA